MHRSPKNERKCKYTKFGEKGLRIENERVSSYKWIWWTIHNHILLVMKNLSEIEGFHINIQ